MPAEAEYRDESRTPTRDEVDAEQGPVLLEFGTSWCGHCRAIALRVAELLERHPEVKHVKVEDGPAGRSAAPSRCGCGRASFSCATARS